MKNVFFAVLTLCTLFITYKVVNLLEDNTIQSVSAVVTAEETTTLATESSTVQAKINPHSTQETDSLSSNDAFANTETSINALSSFDELVTDKESGQKVFNTQPLNEMGFAQIQDYVAELANGLTDANKAQIRELVYDEAMKYQEQHANINVYDMQCSNQLCGIILQSNNTDAISQSLDDLISNNTLRQNSKGGLSRAFTENDVEYGLLIAVITDDRITLQ
ncbi:hypothetical protein [Pseudoalteromonas sp. HF66]|uniref:hypothetical protein n=2 Tax=unclassified Pseudoalteromonas TaxID=194690 RepID=UPI001430C55C|nr:hypothetical protein [Pseudoalteromonas sp. HF66]NIZ06661.1 hypothetical protein [Pseudoalteromonas sp. HF66]